MAGSHSRHTTKLIFIALVLGTLVGVFMPQAAPYVSFLGSIFKLSLSMIVMPIVVTAVLGGMATMGDVRKLGQIGGKTLGYFLLTTLLAITLGLGLVTLIQPGKRHASAEVQAAIQAMPISDPSLAPHALASEILKLYPSKNPEESLLFIENSLTSMQQQGASIENMREAADLLAGSLPLRERVQLASQNTSSTKPSMSEFLEKQIHKALINPFQALANRDVLAVILFAILLGGSLATLGERGQRVFELVGTLNEAVLKIVGLIMRFAPLGVFGLIVDVVSTTGPDVFRELGIYAACVLLGLSSFVFIVLPTLLFIVTKRSPKAFFSALKPAMAVAFSTSSTNATLPVTIRCCEETLKVDKGITRFVLPLGATCNLNGTALYEAVGAVFIAQLFGVSLDITSQVIVALTAALAAIGAAGIPAAGTVTMALVLSSVGLPMEGIGILLALDRPLDMCRTVVNVMGDATCAVLVNHSAAERSA